MNKIRLVAMALVLAGAAVAAYLFWPEQAPDRPEPASTPEATRPAMPLEPFVTPIQPAPDQTPQEEVEEGPDDELKEELEEEDVLAGLEDQPDETHMSVDGLTQFFFDDLARQAVAGYHPARSEHNATNRGVLLLSLSAMNRRYGVDLIGLDHASPSVLEAREEIFSSLLQPEIIDLAWLTFSGYFRHALIDQALAASRSFHGPDGVSIERTFTVKEVSEFLDLLSVAILRIAQAGRLYLQEDQAVAHTRAWLNARSDALAANARYQYAEDLLEYTLRETPSDQDQIRALRQERDAASREILQTIEAREKLKDRLVALYQDDPMTRTMSESDRLYLSQWLYRRLHQYPGRAAGLEMLAGRMQEFAAELLVAAEAVASPAPPIDEE